MIASCVANVAHPYGYRPCPRRDFNRLRIARIGRPSPIGQPCLRPPRVLAASIRQGRTKGFDRLVEFAGRGERDTNVVVCPAEEQKEWREFWIEVATLIARAGELR